MRGKNQGNGGKKYWHLKKSWRNSMKQVRDIDK